MRHRFAPGSLARRSAPAQDDHLLSVMAGPGDRGVDAEARAIGHPPDDAQIGPLQRAAAPVIGELGGEWRDAPCRSSPRRSSHWYPCRGDARFPVAPPPPIPESESPQWAISALTRVPVSCPPAGMHHQPDGFVDHDQIIVFVDDGERDVLAPRLRWRRRWRCKADTGARDEPERRRRGACLIDHDPPFPNQCLDARARENPEGPRPAPCRGVRAPRPQRRSHAAYHRHHHPPCPPNLHSPRDYEDPSKENAACARIPPESPCGNDPAPIYEPPAQGQLPSSSGLAGC